MPPKIEPVEAAHVGQDEDRGEERGQPVLLERHLNVVGGATVGVVGSLLLVDLRERRLDKRRGTAKRRDDPHPEDSARAAQCHGGRNTGDVADAHARGRGHHQGTERRDLAFLLRRLGDDADRFLKEAQRQGARANEEVQADADQERDEHVRIHEARDRIQGAGEVESRTQGSIHRFS